MLDVFFRAKVCRDLSLVELEHQLGIKPRKQAIRDVEVAEILVRRFLHFGLHVKLQDKMVWGSGVGLLFVLGGVC